MLLGKVFLSSFSSSSRLRRLARVGEVEFVCAFTIQTEKKLSCWANSCLTPCCSAGSSMPNISYHSRVNQLVVWVRQRYIQLDLPL